MCESSKIDTERIAINKYWSTFDGSVIKKIHTDTFDWLNDKLKDTVTLDYGCGNGDSSRMLSTAANFIEAVDTSTTAIKNAKQKSINLANIKYTHIKCDHLPFQDNKFDALISNHVIEHTSNPEIHLSESKRVLKHSGKAYFITPNRDVRLFKWQKPWNKHHVTEYDIDEFDKLVAGYFRNRKTYGIYGSANLSAHEISRSNKLKYITLPFTLPFVPERFRKKFLTHLEKYFYGKKEIKTAQSLPDNYYSYVDNIKKKEQPIYILIEAIKE